MPIDEPTPHAAPTPGQRLGSLRVGRWTALSAVALASGLSACASAVDPAARVDDAAGRAALVDEVWRTIDERHVEPAPAGWATARERHRQAVLDAAADEDPETVWRLLDRLAGERHDAHTRVEGPREVRRATQGEVSGLGFTLVALEGRWLADQVEPGSAAARAGLRPGLRLLAWNGQDPQRLWSAALGSARHSSTPQARERRVLRDWLDGPPGSVVALRWARDDGTELAMSLARELRLQPPRWALEQRPGGVGVLRWNRFDPRLSAPLLEALRTLPPLRGLVLDLRGNGGGSFEMAMSLTGALLPQSSEVWHTQRRDGRDHQRLRAGGQALYAGPLVVLVDAGSASGAEMLAAALQHTGRARVLGEPSCGCLLGVRRHVELPGGARLAISEVALQLPDGRRVEGVGVQPDLRVPRSAAALRAGDDEVLRAAERLLLAGA